MGLTCAAENCKKKLKTLSFDCKWCCKSHCLRHQIPEAHRCSDMFRVVAKPDQPIVPAKMSKI